MKVKRIVVMILTIMCILVTVLNVAFKYLLLLFLPFKFDLDLRDAASVGIIGSADGPTSILVENSTASIIITIISALLSISGIIYLIRTRRKI
jgi:Na+-transporting methylmalonyl-CoA/oxaloacetate decarboxylase beta subunit